MVTKNSTINRENVELIYFMTLQIQYLIVLKVSFIYPLKLFSIIFCLLHSNSLMYWPYSDAQHHGSDPQEELLVFIK